MRLAKIKESLSDSAWAARMLHRHIRKVLHYDVAVASTPLGAPARSLLTLMQQVKAAADKGDGVWIRDGGRSVVRISRVLIDNSGTKAIALFQHANIDTADPGFSELATGLIRTEPKLQGEGVAVSAHALFDLTSSASDPHFHHVLLEHVPGLARTLVQGAMQFVLRNCAEYSFIDANGTSRKARPKLEFTPRLSESFLTQLAKGKLSGVTLVKRVNASDMFDADPDMQVREATIKMAPEGKSFGSKALDFVHRAIKRGRAQGWTHAHISYSDHEGNKKSAKFGIDSVNGLDAFVAETSFFEVQQDLAQCEPEIRKDVSQKMNTILKQRAGSLAA